jgi:glycosyltransferase involved in cell wall biosynthesis
VSTNGNGNKDLIRDEYNGYMCDLDQKDIFAARIVDIVKDKSLYNSMSNNALSFASTFDINQYISKLLKLYKQAN